jgi:hypothetical protein
MFAGFQFVAFDSPRVVHQHQHFELTSTNRRALAQDCQQADADQLNRPRDHQRTSFIANSIRPGKTKASFRCYVRKWKLNAVWGILIELPTGDEELPLDRW